MITILSKEKGKRILVTIYEVKNSAEILQIDKSL